MSSATAGITISTTKAESMALAALQQLALMLAGKLFKHRTQLLVSQKLVSPSSIRRSKPQNLVGMTQRWHVAAKMELYMTCTAKPYFDQHCCSAGTPTGAGS